LDKDVVESCYTTAALNALECFPVEVENVEFIMQSENVTFRVSVRGGESDYVLRLHRPGYNSIEELNSERIWVRAWPMSGEVMACDQIDPPGNDNATRGLTADCRRYC